MGKPQPTYDLARGPEEHASPLK